jgi:hypothetical protein
MKLNVVPHDVFRKGCKAAEFRTTGVSPLGLTSSPTVAVPVRDALGRSLAETASLLFVYAVKAYTL